MDTQPSVGRIVISPRDRARSFCARADLPSITHLSHNSQSCESTPPARRHLRAVHFAFAPVRTGIARRAAHAPLCASHQQGLNGYQAASALQHHSIADVSLRRCLLCLRLYQIAALVSAFTAPVSLVASSVARAPVAQVCTIPAQLNLHQRCGVSAFGGMRNGRGHAAPAKRMRGRF